MDEGTTLAVWRLVSSCSILETLDDCLYVGVSAATIFVFEASTHSLSRTIVAYDQCERCVELYGLAAPIVEGTDSVTQGQQMFKWNRMLVAMHTPG